MDPTDRHVMLVFTNPVVGQEDLYHRWYDIHLQEVVSCDGVVSGRRYRAAANILIPQWAVDHGEIGTNGMPFQHFVVYEVGTPYAEAKPALEEQRKNFTVFPDGTMDYDEIIAWRYTPLP